MVAAAVTATVPAMDALFRVTVLLSADCYDHEIDDALGAFVDTQERHSDSPEDPARIHDLDQADAHFDRLG